LLEIFLLFLAASQAPQQPKFAPPGMDCTLKTIVLTKAGPNLPKIQEFLPEHLKVNSEWMKSGVVLAAGPTAEQPLNGLSIFNSTNPEAVRDLMKNDPFIANQVLVVEKLVPWQHCVAQK
jgi:uncharacterized protein YciI